MARGDNGTISNAILGSVSVMVRSITQEISITGVEESASQAKTYYPHYVSQGGFTLVLIHRTRARRDAFNRWMKTYMERVSSNDLASGFLTISVPTRRFTRLGVPKGNLEYGDSHDQNGRVYTTTLSFTAAGDPARRSELSSLIHSDDPMILKHYPGGVQAGWDTGETVYDVRPAPVRPGMPRRAV